MHSKYILLDDDTVFIGSQNLDPRSLYINTELGVIIKSKELRSEIKRSFNQLVMPENAWRVEQSADGFIWRSSDAVLKKEPARNAWQQFQHSVMKLIPISGQL
jgi:putative cardiolipin synthase